jgi:hypothetical protein
MARCCTADPETGLLSQGARTHGFRNELWTLARVATLIERHSGRSKGHADYLRF